MSQWLARAPASIRGTRMGWALGLTLLLAAVSAGPASAHRGHALLSVVEIDAASGQLRVVHRMAAHDIEPALWVIAPKSQASLDDADALAALLAYLGRRFTLTDAQGRRIALTLTASELQGDDVRFVYSGRLAPPAKAVEVESAIFSDIYPDQENQVNVRRAKVTLTALFTPEEADAQMIRFP